MGQAVPVARAPLSNPARATEPGGRLTDAGDRALVPVAPKRSLFGRYQRREGIFVNLVAGVVFGCALGSAAVSSVAFGPFWGLGLFGLGLAGVGWIANAWGLLGNRELAERLEKLLGLEGSGWVFVGVCRGDQNRLAAKLFPPRVETDENVGFFRLAVDQLELRLENGTLEVPRRSVRDVRMEEVVEAPFLHWIRLELYDDEERLDSFLLMSREGETLREQQQANRALFDRIRDWHVSDKLRPLIEAGELPLLTLEEGGVAVP